MWDLYWYVLFKYNLYRVYICKAYALWFILENLKVKSDYAPFWLFTLSLDCYLRVRCCLVPYPHAAHHHVPECCVLVLVNISVELTEECPNALKHLSWKLFAVVGRSYIYWRSNYRHCKVQIRATLFNRHNLPVLVRRLHLKLPVLWLLLPHRQCWLMQLLRLVPQSHTGWWC
jgi:hypothetical protein